MLHILYKHKKKNDIQQYHNIKSIVMKIKSEVGCSALIL